MAYTVGTIRGVEESREYMRVLLDNIGYRDLWKDFEIEACWLIQDGFGFCIQDMLGEYGRKRKARL